jgi:hypothetical protein
MAESPSAGFGSAADLRFGDFLLRPASRELLRGGEPVSLQPKVFELIALLVAGVPGCSTGTNCWIACGRARWLPRPRSPARS